MVNAKKRPSGRQSDATAQQTRQRIVQTARAAFANGGFEAVSLRDIAAQSGVTHGLIRHHFGSKEDIWRAVIDATLQEYLAMMTPLVLAAGTEDSAALETMRSVSRNVILLAARYPDLARLLMYESVEGGARLDYYMAQLAPLKALMTPLFEAVQREGGLAHFRSHETFVLSLLMMGAMPFAMAAFSSKLCNVDILAPEEVERHADRVTATLLPDISRPRESQDVAARRA